MHIWVVTDSPRHLCRTLKGFGIVRKELSRKAGLAANLFTHRWSCREQVNRHIHTFLLAFAFLPRRYRGLAKLTAVYVNGGASFTRNSRRGGCGGALIGLPSYRLQSTQPWATAQMRPLLPIIQNFERTSVRVSLTPLWHTLWWAS